MKFIEIFKLQERVQKWERNKYRWLIKHNSSFLDHFDQELYDKILEVKKLKNNG